MGLADWIAFAALMLGVAGSLSGALWMLLQGQIRDARGNAGNAHKRLDTVQVDLAAMRLHVAENYVKDSRLTEELEKIVGRRMDAFDARLDRQDRLMERIAMRLQVPAVSNDG